MKTIAIIGGNSGIGLATCKTLLNEGYNLHVYSRSSDNLSSLNGRIEIHPFDLAHPEEMEMPEELDGLVYFPGTINLKPFKRLKREDWLNDFEVNVIGAAATTQQALKALTQGSKASVVFFSSVAATTGMTFHASVAASKAAVEGLAKSLAAELAPQIRVNVISPGLTQTPLASNLLSTDAKVKASEDRHPLKAIGQPADVAELVRFLVSDHSVFMTGQVIGMDGGMGQLRPL